MEDILLDVDTQDETRPGSHNASKAWLIVWIAAVVAALVLRGRGPAVRRLLVTPSARGQQIAGAGWRKLLGFLPRLKR